MLSKSSTCPHQLSAAPPASRHEANASPPVSRMVVLLLRLSACGLKGPGVEEPRVLSMRPRTVSWRRLDRVCIGDSAMETLINCNLGILDGVRDAARASVLLCLPPVAASNSQK